MHTAFNILATLVLLPFSGLLERLSLVIIKTDEEEAKRAEDQAKLVRMDERFLSTPSFALEQANSHVIEMGYITLEAVKGAVRTLQAYDKKIVAEVEYKENLVDHYDDEISSYLVKLSSKNLSVRDSHKLAMLLHSIGDLERIADHAINIADSAREMHKKEQSFSPKALEELGIFSQAVVDIVENAVWVLETESMIGAKSMEPFEEAIDTLHKEIKKRHTKRLRKGKCTAEMGFVLSDITNNYERIADHCSNLAISVLQLYEDETHAHEYVDTLQKGEGSEFDVKYHNYLKKYELPSK